MVRVGDRTTLGVSFETVLHAARSNTPWACTVLWREFAPAVAGFARSRGSREPDDVTSEVFLAVFSQLGSFDGDESAFRAFLFTIAWRRVADEHRARGRHGETAEWSDESDPRVAPSAEEAAGDRLAESSVLAVMDALPEDQRTVMVLRIVGDLTIEQIAGITGKRAGAVKALQRRALESLRKKVEADPYPFAWFAR
jgi:RNA polymerase sigma-70 factor (ECF subfamily)